MKNINIKEIHFESLDKASPSALLRMFNSEEYLKANIVIKRKSVNDIYKWISKNTNYENYNSSTKAVMYGRYTIGFFSILEYKDNRFLLRNSLIHIDKNYWKNLKIIYKTFYNLNKEAEKLGYKKYYFRMHEDRPISKFLENLSDKIIKETFESLEITKPLKYNKYKINVEKVTKFFEDKNRLKFIGE